MITQVLLPDMLQVWRVWVYGQESCLQGWLARCHSLGNAADEQVLDRSLDEKMHPILATSCKSLLND